MKRILILISLTAFLSFSHLCAQEHVNDEHATVAAQANNPLANLTSVVFQNYYMTKLNEAPEGSYMNNAWLRFAQPFAKGKFLLRASLPLNTIAIPSSGTISSTSGLGDINVFASYNFVSKPTATLGIGPMLTAPTASADPLGTGKWEGGFAFVAFIAKSPVFQFGGLITWQASFAGNENRPSTSIGAVQPFYFWQLGKGTYLRGAPIWTFDFENGGYSVPIGLGIGKILKMNNTVFNLFIEPQYSVVIDGRQPQFQLMSGLITQFIHKR